MIWFLAATCFVVAMALLFVLLEIIPRRHVTKQCNWTWPDDNLPFDYKYFERPVKFKQRCCVKSRPNDVY